MKPLLNNTIQVLVLGLAWLIGLIKDKSLLSDQKNQNHAMTNNSTRQIINSNIHVDDGAQSRLAPQQSASHLLFLLFFCSVLVLYSNYSVSAALAGPPSTKIIPVFYQQPNDHTQTFIQALKIQLDQKLATPALKFIDITQSNTRQIEEWLNKSQHCAMTIGEIATRKVLSIRKPLNYFSLLTSRSELDKLNRIYARLGIKVSGIYHEQPFERQIFLSKALNANLRSVAIMVDQTDKFRLPDYQNTAKKYGLDVQFQILERHDPPEKFLDRITRKGSFLLISNNRHLYTESQLVSLVLAAYYRGVNLIGSRFEDAKIGTLASIFTAPTSLSIEVGNAFKPICESPELPLPEPRYANSFSIVVNKQIAENMKIENIDINQLSQKVNQLEANKALVNE
ncbi:hypothetical protein [Aliikangiella maris]|uniref:Uncharacterized protein n=2 Tax=Aliikangiella maris TaxID=3162458 RepID=A0ABV3MKP9_9GAMM